MGTYHWLHLRAAGRTWNDAYGRLIDAPAATGTDIWGAFHGLFGLASNELLLVAYQDGSGPTADPTAAITDAGFEVVRVLPLVPTVRPQTFVPLTRPGLYVFRLFDVSTDDIDEVARLSAEAWIGFENDAGYAAQPQGLFAPADRTDRRGVMVLLTWYDGLQSWEASRGPSPETVALFRRRRELTTGTIAYATRLVDR